MLQRFLLVRAESAVGSLDELLLEEVLPGENVVPEDADLEVPGMRGSVGVVNLLNDLLCLIGGIVDIELVRNLGAILHVLPIVDVKLKYLAKQVGATFSLHLENCVFNFKVERHCGCERHLRFITKPEQGSE